MKNENNVLNEGQYHGSATCGPCHLTVNAWLHRAITTQAGNEVQYDASISMEHQNYFCPIPSGSKIKATLIDHQDGNVTVEGVIPGLNQSITQTVAAEKTNTGNIQVKTSVLGFSLVAQASLVEEVKESVRTEQKKTGGWWSR